jgi:hypothetical protein
MKFILGTRIARDLQSSYVANRQSHRIFKPLLNNNEFIFLDAGNNMVRPVKTSDGFQGPPFFSLKSIRKM